MDDLRIGMDLNELPPHERKLILAYREHLEKQEDIDRILNLYNEWEPKHINKNCRSRKTKKLSDKNVPVLTENLKNG